MADEYRDIGTIEELTVYCLGERSGAAVEHFTEMISLKKKNDNENTYSSLVEYCIEPSILLERLVGYGI